MFAQRPPLRRGGSCRGSRGGRPMVAPTFTAGTAIKFVGADILARQSLRRLRRHLPLHKGGYPLRRGRADEYPQGAGRICNAPSSRTAALGIGPYKVYRRFSDFHTPQVQSKALVDRRGPGKPSESFPRSLFFCQAFSFWRSKRKCRPFPLSWKKQTKKTMWTPNRLGISKNSARWRKNTEKARKIPNHFKNIPCFFRQRVV